MRSFTGLVSLAFVLLLCAPHALFAVDGTIAPIAQSVLQTAEKRRFNVSELAHFNGVDPAQPIFLAVRGIVFDVSAGREFYAADARYQAFAGKDATCGIARMSLAKEDLGDRCEGLKESERDLLGKIFQEVYLAKYPVVGHLAGGAFFPNGICCAQAHCGPCEN